MNRLTELVVVGAGGALHQRGLVLDDCLLPVMPLLCFAAGREGGNITLEGLVLGDASCAAIALSTATDWLLKARQPPPFSLFSFSLTGSAWRPCAGARQAARRTGMCPSATAP